MDGAWREALAGGVAGLIVLAGAGTAAGARGAARGAPAATAAAAPSGAAPRTVGPATFPAAEAAGVCAGAPQASAASEVSASAAQRQAALAQMVSLLQSLPAYPRATDVAPTPYGVATVGADGLTETGGAALGAPGYSMSPNLVDVYRIWRVSAPTATVLAWVQSWEAGAGLVQTGAGQSSGPTAADGERSLQFSARGPAGADGPPQVEVAVSAGLVRYDAMIVMTPPRPAGETVPAGATSAVITACNGIPEQQVGQSTVTDPAKIAALAAAVNALPREAGGVMFCGDDTGLRLVIDFRHAAAPDLRVTEFPACAWASLGSPGQWPALTDQGLRQAIDAATGWTAAQFQQAPAPIGTLQPAGGAP